MSRDQPSQTEPTFAAASEHSSPDSHGAVDADAPALQEYGFVHVNTNETERRKLRSKAKRRRRVHGHNSFSNMSLDELVELRNEIDRLIAEKIEQEQVRLQKRMDALRDYQPQRGRSSGRRSSSITLRRGQSLKGRKVPIKYRGPTGETWTGRGNAPRWLSDLEAKGKKRESYLV